MEELDSELNGLKKDCLDWDAEQVILEQKIKLLKETERHFRETGAGKLIGDLIEETRKELEKQRQALEIAQKTAKEKHRRLNFVKEMRKIVAHQPENKET